LMQTAAMKRKQSAFMSQFFSLVGAHVDPTTGRQPFESADLSQLGRVQYSDTESESDWGSPQSGGIDDDDGEGPPPSHLCETNPHSCAQVPSQRRGGQLRDEPAPGSGHDNRRGRRQGVELMSGSDVEEVSHAIETLVSGGNSRAKPTSHSIAKRLIPRVGPGLGLSLPDMDFERSLLGQQCSAWQLDLVQSDQVVDLGDSWFVAAERAPFPNGDSDATKAEKQVVEHSTHASSSFGRLEIPGNTFASEAMLHRTGRTAARQKPPKFQAKVFGRLPPVRRNELVPSQVSIFPNPASP